MDTKALYDLANEADIGFQHDDGYHDATQVWIDGYFDKPEYLVDLWIDALADLCDEKNKDKLATAMKDFGYVHSKVDMLVENARLSTGCALSFSTSLNSAQAHLGSDIYLAVRKFVGEFVAENAEEWWSDCVSYHSDMNDGAKEDWLYEAYRDRMLEERE